MTAWVCEQAAASAASAGTAGAASMEGQTSKKQPGAQRRVKKKVSWRKGGDDVAESSGGNSGGHGSGEQTLEERLSEGEQAMGEPFSWKVRLIMGLSIIVW